MENQPGQKMLGLFAMGNRRIQKAFGLFATGNRRIQKAFGLFVMGNRRIQKAFGLFAMGNHSSQMIGLFAIVFLMQFGTSFPECKANQTKCDTVLEYRLYCSTGRSGCYHQRDVCDGFSCCKYGEDEKDCQNWRCAEGRVKCGGGSSDICMLSDARCDGKKGVDQSVGCTGDDDEADCEKFVCRGVGIVQCPTNDLCFNNHKNKRCSIASYFPPPCGPAQSDDKSYDKYCTVNKTVTCASPWIKCPDGSSCMVKEWRCDGTTSCADKSDEDDCDACNLDDDFKCAGGKNITNTGRMCIHKMLKCDGVEHCEDGSDEKGCPTVAPKKNTTEHKESNAGNINGLVVSTVSAMTTILIPKF